jgi:hypothetical protein
MTETAFHKNEQYHSLAVGHMERCDEKAFTKRYNIAHSLLVIQKDVMTTRRLPFTKMCNLTHKLFVIHRATKDVTTQLPYTKMCNATHSLLVIGKDMIRLTAFHRMCIECHSLSVGHRKGCDV